MIISRIKIFGHDDFVFSNGFDNANKFKTYEDWLRSLDDENLLDAYRRVTLAEGN